VRSVDPARQLFSAIWVLWKLQAYEIGATRLRPKALALGDHQPTTQDVEDARRVKRALDLLCIPLVDYVVVGESITSLVHRRVI
jgi:hypothetical protein